MATIFATEIFISYGILLFDYSITTAAKKSETERMECITDVVKSIWEDDGIYMILFMALTWLIITKEKMVYIEINNNIIIFTQMFIFKNKFKILKLSTSFSFSN